MAPRTALFLVLALAMSQGAASAETPAAPTSLISTALQERTDRLALQLPAATLAETALRSVEDVPLHLLSSTGLTPEEEFGRAAAVHEHLLAKRPLLPTPAAAQRVFDRLVAEVPPYLMPSAYRWRLTVLGGSERDAFATGGGFVYIGKPWVESLLADPERGEAALAFVLADQIAPVALGHARRCWELAASVEQLAGFVPFPLPYKRLDLAVGAAPGRFVYTALETVEADRFALHLCRNAGFALDAALDSVRLAAAPANKDDKDDSHNADMVARDSGALIRLRRLLMERDGLLGDDDTTHGLFLWDRKARRLVRCGAREIGPGERPIVLVHGMRASVLALGGYLLFLEKQPETADRPLLVFHYPSNGSLSRSGQFLTREIRRVVAEPDKTIFVCHSAGGLVVRWYTEVCKGGFDRAIFLATPQAGTRMAAFKGFVDAGRFFLDLPYGGLGYSFADEFGEGDGQIAADLHPDSLFLRRLAREKPPSDRYRIIYGQIFDWLQALKLQAGFVLGKQYVKEAVADFVPFPGWQGRLMRWVEEAPFPEEIARGDLAVSVRSAALPGVTHATGVFMQHEAFRYDRELMRHVLAAIVDR